MDVITDVRSQLSLANFCYYYIQFAQTVHLASFFQEVLSANEQPRYHVDLSRFAVSDKAATFPVLDVLLQPVVFESYWQGAGKKARYVLQMGTAEVKTSSYQYDTSMELKFKRKRTEREQKKPECSRFSLCSSEHSHFPLVADCTL